VVWLFAPLFFQGGGDQLLVTKPQIRNIGPPPTLGMLEAIVVERNAVQQPVYSIFAGVSCLLSILLDSEGNFPVIGDRDAALNRVKHLGLFATVKGSITPIPNLLPLVYCTGTMSTILDHKQIVSFGY
jgi:hypothetical protein